jgi:hypothetical protein
MALPAALYSGRALVTFLGGAEGRWQVARQAAVVGEPLEAVSRIEMLNGPGTPRRTAWTLRGVSSNARYVTRAERAQLTARHADLGRPGATRAALIPIRKSERWWQLAQDERREILEERSAHIASGLKVLPAVARQLIHCRDLGEPQPFDFLTWFEYAPEDSSAFEDLVATLRATEEWNYVDREVDLRLTLGASSHSVAPSKAGAQ